MDPWCRRFWTLLVVVMGVPGLIAAPLGRRPVPRLERAFSVAGLFEWWFLVNLQIANHFRSANVARLRDLAAGGERLVHARLGRDRHRPFDRGLLDRMARRAWRRAGTAGGVVFKASCPTRGHLDGVYRAASLFGLGASLVVVGVTLQKFRRGHTAVAPVGAPS